MCVFFTKFCLVLYYNFRNWILWRCLNISKELQNKEFQINNDIRDETVRLIGPDGEQLGIVSSAEARKIAREKQLDLVKVADKAVPPVCKIINYGKYKFELAKKEKESKKNQHIADIKEVRLSVNIDTHDFETKVSHANRFISNGDKVKVSIRFKGREMGHPEIGQDIMKRFSDSCAEFANVERPAKLDGRTMLMFLAPKPKTKTSNKQQVLSSNQEQNNNINNKNSDNINKNTEDLNLNNINNKNTNIENLNSEQVNIKNNQDNNLQKGSEQA